MVQESLVEGIIRSLRQNAGWAITIIGLAVIFSFLLNRHIPTVYQSESLLRVLTTENEQRTSLAASMQGILSQKIITSQIAQKSGLSENEIRREEVISLIDAGPGLVKLMVRYENPVLLKELGNAVIQVLSEQFLGYSSEAQEFEIKNLQKKLEHLEARLTEIRQTEVSDNPEKAEEIDEATLLLESNMHQIQEKIDTLGQKLQITPKEVFYYQEEETPEYRKFTSQLKEERNELAELFKNYKEKHPRVIACKNRIESIEFNLKQARTKVQKQRANSEYTTLAAEIASEKEKLTQLATQLIEKPVSLNKEEVNELSRDTVVLRTRTLEELHRKTLLELEEAKVNQNNAAGKINVLKKDATPPQTLGFTSFQRDCIGMLSGVLMAIFLLYSPAPIRAELVGVSSNVMAGVAQASNLAMLTAEPAEIILEVPSLVNEPLALPYLNEESHHATAHDERLIALNDPDSTRLKPFKSLVSSLQISISESQTRIVLVGSARSGAGRTTLLANTAILLAQAGYSVLMIDANFRNPVLHRIFDLTNAKGLANALNGADPKNLIQKTVVKNLSLLSAGFSPASPAEALGSQEMIELLANLKRKVEIIIIDTPALLEYPEAGILASHTGAMVFLHRDGEPEEDLRAARNQLKTVRAKVFGYVKI